MWKSPESRDGCDARTHLQGSLCMASAPRLSLKDSPASSV
jgi:hypothetical protein